MRNYKTGVLACLSIAVLLSMQPVVSAKDNSDNYYTKIKSVIHRQDKLNLKNTDLDKVSDALAYAELQTATLATGKENSPFSHNFKNGLIEIKKIIPIFDLGDNIDQVMVVYNEGYIIVDADNGEIIQFGYDQVNTDYLDKNDKIYVDGATHFGTSNDIISDFQYKGQKIANVKKTNSVKKSLKAINQKWGQLTKEEKEILLKGFSTGYNTDTGGTSDYITSPTTWLTNYYNNTSPHLTNLRITNPKWYYLSVPEINQNDSNYPQDQDCAVISTLEIMNYYWPLSDTDKTKVYNAIINSSYFDKDTGVDYKDNNNIFALGAATLGKPQQNTGDDPEGVALSPTYNTFNNYLHNNGPIYLSLSQAPYIRHTITVKGIDEFVTSYYDVLGAYQSFTDDFVYVNDHWLITPGNAYMDVRLKNVTWYLSAIKLN